MSLNLKGEFSTRKVWLDGKELLPEKSQKAWNHSPDGFAWGYEGSGPAQLALAVLLARGLREVYAVESHQQFKRDYIAKLPQSDFEIEIPEAEWQIWLVEAGKRLARKHREEVAR